MMDDPLSTDARACLASGARAPAILRRSSSVRAAEPAELSAAGLTWIHFDSPDSMYASVLAHRFGWHPLDVEDVLSKRQRPKVDDYAEEGYLFAVLHFPVYDRTIQRLNAAELDVFIGPDYLITLPNVELLPITRLFRRCEEDDAFREQLFSKGSGRLLYEVLDDLFDYCFPILDKIGHKLDALEDDVFEGRSEEVVRDISNVKQEIISYRKIIKPERSTLRLLERHVERFLPEELELYFDDIVDAAERIWDILDNYKEVVEALEGTNESVISHRQNDVLRILTVFSVDPPAADPDHRLLRNERRLPRLRHRLGVLDGLRRDGRRAGRACSASSAGSAGSEAVVAKRLWAPWRLEYVQRADELARLHLLRARGGAARPPRRRGVRAAEQVPVRVGHLLVAPVRHVGDFGALTESEALEIHRLASAGIDALAAEYAPQGFNLGWNLGRIAGAGIVDHVHSHVVPRWAGDTNFMPVLADVKVVPGGAGRDRGTAPRRLADRR